MKVENIMEKGEKIAHYKQCLHVLCNFFFCHYIFKKLSAAEASESVYMRERVNPHILPQLQQTPFETIVRKGNNAQNEQSFILLNNYTYF